MRSLVIVALGLLASAAHAENPDGPPGTMWIEPHYAHSIGGSFKLQDQEERDVNQETYGMELGVVSAWAPFSLIFAFDRTETDAMVGAFDDPLFKEKLSLLSLRLRVYIH